MAVAHIDFNHGSPHGSLLHSGLSGLENALANLNEIKATMQLMIDGDGSQAAHFTYATDKFGFASDAVAKAAWDELNSVLFKLNTNSSVTDVNAALLQVFNKFR
jgi:hypothetical protein